MGWDLGGWEVTFEHAAGPRQGDFKRGAGPLFRTFPEGERQSQVEPLDCGVSEFGGRALSEGVCVGFRPSVLEGVSEGVSECRRRSLGGGEGRGLGSGRQEGGSEGRGLGLGAHQASLCLCGQGKRWPHSLPLLRTPPPPSPPTSPPSQLDP